MKFRSLIQKTNWIALLVNNILLTFCIRPKQNTQKNQESQILHATIQKDENIHQ